MTKLFGVFTSTIQRRILSSFAIVIALVIIVAVAGYYQLDQVRVLSEQLIPSSSQTGLLQDFALAVSSLDANLERYFVIGGEQFRENIQQDLAVIDDALASMKENASAETLPAILELEEVSLALEGDVLALLEVESADLTSKEVNERIISVYSQIESVEELHRQISTETLDQLQDTVLLQEQIASRVIVQFVVLGVSVFLVAVLASLFVTRSIAIPLAGLAETASQVAAGDLEQTAKVEREDEIGALAKAFDIMTVQLREMIGSLEQQVADRTADLEQRSAYLEASAEIGRAAVSILESDALIRQVVDLIRERLGLYYVGLFLLDEAGAGASVGAGGGERWAVLRAGTGQAGQAMLARGHRIQVGEGMVGWSIAHSQPRVALEVGEDAVRLATAELPETRSEAALPLRSRGQVVGALSVQHTQAGAFDQDTLAVLQIMADQVAVALDNARLFAESQAALEAERLAYGELSRDAWVKLLRARPDLGFLRNQQGLAPASDLWWPEMETALRTGETTPRDGDAATVAVPIKVRDQVIGVVDGRKPDGSQWAAEEIELLEALADQLNVALEGARLYRDTQRRETRERLIGEITTRMRESLEMENVLQAAAGEIRQALGLDRVVVRLATPETAGDRAHGRAGERTATRPEPGKGNGDVDPD